MELRPKTLDLEYGHFEGDTLVSGKKTGSKASLTILCERKAKYTDFEKIPNLKPLTNNQALTTMMAKLSKIHSLTLDNGLENQWHERLGIPTFFCDPYSSWQKARIENTNKLIRWFIPKGTDINNYSKEYLEWVKHILNNKPRKSLGYKTPLEVMLENNLLKVDNQFLQSLQIKKPEAVALQG